MKRIIKGLGDRSKLKCDRLFPMELNNENIVAFFTKDDGVLNCKRLEWKNIYRYRDLFEYMVNYFEDEPVDPETEPAREVLYRIVNNIRRRDIPMCKECGEHPVVFRKFKIGYGEFCCLDCAKKHMNDESHKAKLERDKEYQDYLDSFKPKEYTPQIIYDLIYGEHPQLMESLSWDAVKKYDMKLFEYMSTYFKEPIDYDFEKPNCVLYRMINNIPTYPICAREGCNNRVKFQTWKRGFATHCSYECRGFVDRTEEWDRKIQRKEHGKQLRAAAAAKREADRIFRNTPFNSVDDVIKHMIWDNGQPREGRCLWKHVNCMPHLKEFFINYFDGRYDSKNSKIIELLYMMVNGMKERPKCAACDKDAKYKSWGCGFGVFCSSKCSHSLKAQELRIQKIEKTHKAKCGALWSSKLEDETEQQLIKMFGTDGFERNYSKDERYPYFCDFYIPSLDLFIEIQGHLSHHTHPYGTDFKEDDKLIRKWEKRLNEGVATYADFIKTFKVSDVEKRICAHNNGINFVEIYANTAEDVIKAIKDYIDNGKEKYALYLYK